MNITAEQYERMMRFMNLEMELDEMKAFKQELDSNPELREQLDFEQSIRDSFALRKLEDLDAPADAGIAHKPTIVSLRRWIALGAAMVAAILSLFIFKETSKKTQDIAVIKEDSTNKVSFPNPVLPTPPEPVVKDEKIVDYASLFKQYFRKDSLPEEYPVMLAEALTDYEHNDYKALLRFELDKLPQTRSANSNNKEIMLLGNYYKGVAFLQTGRTRDAIENLYQVLNLKPEKELQTKAEWYLALAYLKENNRQKAIELCKSIVDSNINNLLVKNAKTILDALEK